MERTNYSPKKLNLRESMIRHIRSVNKYLTVDYLEELTLRELLGECHPTYRADYEKLM